MCTHCDVGYCYGDVTLPWREIYWTVASLRIDKRVTVTSDWKMTAFYSIYAETILVVCLSLTLAIHS